MSNNVEVSEREVYGNTLVYPANETAKLLAKLGKTTTFTDAQLSTIRALGYQVTLVVNSARGL